MENRNNVLLIAFIAIAVLLSWGLTKDFNERQAPLAQIGNVCKQDSLQILVDSLQNECESLKEDITVLEDGFDTKERRYEDILFEYEFGIDRIKETHPNAYKEFHRIISYRERYSKQDERDNKKRLSRNNF